MTETAIHTTEQQLAAVFHIQGILNHESATALVTSIENTISSGKKRIILNCEKLSFISSRGIGALLFMSKVARQNGGGLVLCSLNDENTALFSLLKLGRYIQTTSDFTQALRTQLADVQNDIEHKLKIEDVDKEEIIARSGDVGNVLRIFDNPIIAECASCATLVRIPEEGYYICPSCKTEFRVKGNGTIVF